MTLTRTRAIVTGLLAAIALGLWFVPPGAMGFSADWIERQYAASRYLAWQGVATPFANLVPFALFDLLLAIVAIGLVTTIVRRYRRVEGRTRWRRIGRASVQAAFDVAVVAAVLAIWFSLAWGANYRRVPLRARLDYDRARVTRDAAIAMAQTSVREMNRLHPLAHAMPWPSLQSLPATLGGAFSRAQRDLGQPRGAVPGRPKATLLQPYFRWAAIDGLTDPFFLETLVNTDALPIERPFIVAHEWSHLAGFAHEAEANFLGWLICQQADPQAQYSAWISLYWHLASSLPAAERRAIDAVLEAGPRADLQAVIERYRRSAPRVRVIAWSLYDRFLKANRVTEGVASYDAVVALVLGTAFQPGWRPVLNTGPRVPPVPVVESR